MSLPSEYVFLVWLARKLRGTVAWSEDRRENLIAAFHSRDQHVQLEGAFDEAGKLIALSADVVANIGAYSCFPTTCGVEPLMAMAELPGPYDVAAYACVARGVATHTCTMAPYRGVSRPVITFAIERLMDKAAAAFDLGPDEIRRRNLIRKFPYTSATGLVFDEGSYIETLDQAIAHVDLKAFRARQREARTRGRYLGIGFATFSERTGYGSPAFAARGMEITPGWETVEITMDPSGAVEARIGASPARTRAAHHACPNHRRPSRRRAGARAHRAWRHRPHALWLGHVRQPLAGHCRRRVAVGGAKDPQKASHHRQPCVGGRGRRHRAGKRPRQSVGHRPRGADRDAGPRRLSSDPSVQGRDQRRA